MESIDMNKKEIIVHIPEGYEIDKENSSFECIKFKPKSLTYEDVAKELFKDKFYFINVDDSIRSTTNTVLPNILLKPCNAASEKQLKKLLAINKLMNVAKYLNGDWKPDWRDDSEKFYLFIDHTINKIYISVTCVNTSVPVYFKTNILAKQAINILGEDTIRLALSTDW